MRSIPLLEAKSRLAGLVRTVEGSRRKVVISRNGKAAAVLLGVAEYEGWKETQEILADKDMMRQIRQSKKTKLKAKHLYTVEELDKLFGLEK